MPILLAALALLSLGFSSFGTIPAAASHRVLVLDIGRWPSNRPGSRQHRLTSRSPFPTKTWLTNCRQPVIPSPGAP
jgi:hypothetical protein